ncbi:MAG: YceI family protein [Flavobacteriaceae bacterium]|nr:YceI family protein [Flavobacteriaceae bacterium]
MIKQFFALLLIATAILPDSNEKIIARQGRVSFFSYTTVENIQADNNQVLSIIDLEDGTIAVSMLMNAFVFEKALMKGHFNESYVESDLYPKGIFEGQIIDFDPNQQGEQIKMIDGVFTMHGVPNELSIKTKIENNNGTYVLTGTFETLVEDYDIKVPPLLSKNISDRIEVNFRFEFQPYEN